MEFHRIRYADLNGRQQENFNFQKISAVLADYGFSTIRLSDDWNGADFIAVHITGDAIKVQLKGRLGFAQKYIGKDLHMAFPSNGAWYVYPHDDVLAQFPELQRTDSWTVGGEYHFPRLSQAAAAILEPYRLEGDVRPVDS